MQISIITPSYNQGNFIERTINSVLSQNIADLEYFVIDGGSTDHTIAILQKYNNQLQWVSEPDRGQAHAVNKGLAQSRGEIIGWLNSDDIYYPGAVNKVIDFFNKNQNVDIIYGDANHIDTNDNILEAYYTEKWDFAKFKEVCFICQPAVFFRRKLISKHGILDQSLQYCMDYEYWLRLAKEGVSFFHLNELLAGSRLHADTKTLGSRVKVHAEINSMLKKHFNQVPDRWLSNYAHAVVENNPEKYPHKNRQIVIKTFLASLYWNKKISRSLLSMLIKWIKTNFFTNKLRIG